MIRHIKGIVADVSTIGVVLDVHGMGYLVRTTTPYRYQLESTILFHTYLAVRETALDLYGFASRDDLHIFELLLTIPKIGPKSALDILTKADGVTLKNAVLSNDPSYLTKVSGIGKKTAEKIVTELKDSFDHLAGAHLNTNEGELPSYTADAIDALVALGYPPVDARRAILALPPHITSANEAVRSALQVLGQA